MRVSLLILLLCGTDISFAQEGRLDAVRADVRTPSVSTPSSSSGSSDTVWNDDPMMDDDAGYGTLFMYAVASPFWLPVKALDDDYRCAAVFVAYPYADKWDGLIQRGRGEMVNGRCPDTWDRLLSIRASAEAGTDFANTHRVGTTFLVDTMTRFGIGGSVQFFEEDKRALQTDRLVIGDVNALFRFAQSERCQFRAGIGARFLDDRRQTDWGINFVYGWEWFPGEPLSLSGQLEAGTLGHAGVFRATGRIGYVWKRLEAYVGYDYLRIGSTDLQGPMLGFRFWF